MGKERLFSSEEEKKDEIFSNKNLIGHIKEEYSFQNLELPDELIMYLEDACHHGPFGEVAKSIDVLSHSAAPTIESMWCNFQKKHEFNPLHVHSGFASFIIFVNIPYDLEDETNHFVCADEMEATSKLFFLNYLPNTNRPYLRPVNVDKSFEGKMVMFDAQKPHQVYPFYTSDDYRITV